ncbi:MAG: phosphotransferase family protein [Microthrixaceae bacterium]
MAEPQMAPDATDPDGIDTAAVTAWFESHVTGCKPPLAFDLIAGGHSNLTFSVTDSGEGHWVLRRPPLGQVLASAHDMGREHKIISALADTDVPVPATIGLSADDSVNGSPFYVMDFVDGTVVRSRTEAEALTEQQRSTAGESLVDVMAAIHAVDVDAVGLGDLGRKENYIARQLKRWYGQFESSDGQVDGGLDLPSVHAAHDRLSANIPEQSGASIVHGDYRLDNCMLGSDGAVNAVLDWEICTLGDPMADVGLLWVYWTDPGSDAVLPQASPTALAGFPTKAQLMDRYQAASGRDIGQLDFYIAFGYWKLTCIIAGVYARYAGGAMGDVPPEQVEGFRHLLESLAALTEESCAAIT